MSTHSDSDYSKANSTQPILFCPECAARYSGAINHICNTHEPIEENNIITSVINRSIDHLKEDREENINAAA